MDKVQALTAFWNTFLPAYDETLVLDEAAVMPYITFAVVTDGFDSPFTTSVSLWYRSTSWKAITKKAEAIEDAIGAGGKLVPYEDGAIWIKKGSPFSQRLSDPDPAVRRIVLNVEMEYLNEV